MVWSLLQQTSILLQNFDLDSIIETSDTASHFYLPGGSGNTSSRESMLATLVSDWSEAPHNRHRLQDDEWTSELSIHLDKLADLRIAHVNEWISVNLARFKAEHADVEALRRAVNTAAIELRLEKMTYLHFLLLAQFCRRSNVQLCKAKCSSCHLFCVKSRYHGRDDSHDCSTSHECPILCEYDNEHEGNIPPCGFPCVFILRH